MADDFVQMFAWGGVVLLSLVGWGRIVHHLLGQGLVGRPDTGPDWKPDWGLSAGWGMALAVAVGGLLSQLGLISANTVIGFVVLGAVLALACAFRDGIARPDLGAWCLVGLVLVALPVLARYAAAVHFQATSCGDDDIAYFPMIARLLQTGTLIEPFSLRRLAGFGGQTFLQSLVVVLGSEANAYLMDRGIALVAAFGLVLGLFRRQGPNDLVPLGLTLLVVVLLPFPLLNSHSHLTGLVLFLTLFRTLDRIAEPTSADWRSLVLVGLVVAGAASLRANFSFAAAIIVVLFWWPDRRAAETARTAVAASARALATVGSATLVALGPWMLLLQQSSGTPLYPLLRGNHRPEFENYAAQLDLGQHLAFVAEVFADPRLSLFLLPMVLYAFRRPSRAGLACYVSAIVTAAAMAWAFTLSDPQNIHRYVAPVLNTAFIGTGVIFIEHARQSGNVGKAGNWILGAAILVLMPVMVSKDVGRLIDNWGHRPLALMERTHYGNMQAAVPAGARLLTAVDHPFVLDFRRNEILPVDIPGAASPDPGMPFFKGPEALRAYLLGQGISHVAYRDFRVPGGCLYNRRLWEHYLGGPDGEFRMASKFYLDFMANVEALEALAAASGPPLFRAGGLVVIRL